MTDTTDFSHISPEHLAVLYEITRSMNSSLEFDAVLNAAMDSIMQLTKAERGALMIVDHQTGELAMRVARGVDDETLVADAPYSTTIVRQVVETRQPLLTNNAQYDERYTPGKSIIIRGLRAVLCAPMLVKDRLVGAVYVDTSMRSGSFSENDRDLLMAVAGQAAIAIENARLYAVAVEKGRMEHELQVAREIQSALIPQQLPAFAGYEIAAAWETAREMAGDFYDVFQRGDDTLSVVVADVSDKGAGAALFMAASRSYIRSYARVGWSPVEVLAQTNDLIAEDAENGMFVTAYYSVLRHDGSGEHVNAGHNPPVLYRYAGDAVALMPLGGRAIGWFPDNPLSAVPLQLAVGDMLIYYTDGLTEAENPAGELYGIERLQQVISSSRGLSASIVRDRIIQDVQSFSSGLPLTDDLTLVVVRYIGV